MPIELLVVTVILGAAFLGAQICRRLGYPQIIGQMLAGFLVTLPFWREQLFVGGTTEVVSVLASIGSIFLLFLTGFEINLGKLRSVSGHSFAIGILSMSVTFALGMGLAVALGFSATAAFMLGLCLSITAMGTTVGLLMGLNQLSSRLGTVILGASILVDVMSVLIFSGFILYFRGDSADLIWLPVKLLLFILFSVLVYISIPKVVHAIEHQHSEVSIFDVSLLIGLIFAMAAELAGFDALLGALLGGMIVNHSLENNSDRKREEQDMKLLTFGFIIPFFFVNMGLHYDFGGVWEHRWLILAVGVVAMAGKFGGVYLSRPFDGLGWNQLTFVGWGMNIRGVVELVIAGVALELEIIPQSLYIAIVTVTFVTTILAPFMMRAMIRKDPSLTQKSWFGLDKVLKLSDR